MNKNEIARQGAILQRRYELKYFPKVKKAIESRISSLIGIIESQGISSGERYLHGQVDSGRLPQVISDLYLTVGKRFAMRQWRLLQEQKRIAKSKDSFKTKGFGFNEVWTEFLKNYLFRFLLDKITYEVSEYTRKVLLNTIVKAIEQGWGVRETVKELEDLPLSKTQAARIVRSEITRAANAGTMAGASTFEYEQTKEWMAAMDLRTRGRRIEDHASHVGLDGMVVDYDQPFIDPRNGDALMFPGDPNASAASTINCRCSMAVVAKLDERGRLIPKRRISVIPPQNRNRTIITI